MEVNTSFGAIDIAVSGLRAQEKNISLISSNVANAQTTDDGTGEPYRRVEALLKASDDGIGGVSIEEITTDASSLPRILRPGHPNADEQGYVEMPNVSLPTEMINLNIATKTYQANAAILKRYQSMIETTLELLK
ncbi:MAG: flagellar basal body rod protein FlgC [Anaerohalosphaeraceae bacterium]|nr:flagellar basal body rod protein FlgC [Anaerohalosphaeraceae bacterium]